MIVRTIGQYIEAKEKGVYPIGFDDSTPPEVIKYIMNDVDNTNKKNLSSKFALKKEGNKYVYDLNSKINFGRHKGNELRNVYKCDPSWIEWAILNASGFVISESVMEIILLEKVFNIEDLSNFIKVEGVDKLKINLKEFHEKNNRFLAHERVREEYCVFREDVRKINLKKLNSEMSTSELFKGGKWGATNDKYEKMFRNKTIVIITNEK